MTTALTPTQELILRHAHEHNAGKVIWFPDNINGGARTKVLDGLLNHQLIEHSGEDYWVTAKGFFSIGASPIAESTPVDRSKTRVARGNSKQAQVIAMLARPEGATIEQICTATGWQSHTVRGTFAGTFKKKLGLNITSTKDDAHGRVYRIEGATA
ncbi:MAG: DUF3489 domain-containing protein [Rhodoferax sp.]